MKNEIKLVQAPVISHELKKAGKRVTDRLAELDLENQVATIDTVKSLKTTRSELSKEFQDYENDRKFIKTACLTPYKELEDLYKIEISEKYQEADKTLKDKIGTVEIKIKEEKEADIKLYFIELCQSEEIDFVTFDKVGIEIKLSDSMKSYKEKCNLFIQKVCSDVDLIKTEEFEAEIMAEFKQSLNASESIISVKSRKRREKEEKDRIIAQENLRRSTSLENVGMSFDEMTKSFAYNNDIYISKEVAESFGKSEFNTKLVELEEKIKADKKANAPKPEVTKEPTQQTIKEPVTEPKKEVKEPLKAPIKEVKREIVTAKFEASATLAELKALGQYMKNNNITYKNI